jgi:hypothetical protein
MCLLPFYKKLAFPTSHNVSHMKYAIPITSGNSKNSISIYIYKSLPNTRVSK